MIKSVNDSTYQIDEIGEVKARITLGGEREEKFVPNANFSFAMESVQEQFFWNLNRPSVVVDQQKEAFSTEANEVRLSTGIETDAFRFDKEGNFKWDIEFASKPPSNVFEWDILCSKGIRHYYQPPLTQEEIDAGDERPENVVGSYAVYCDRRGNYKDVKYRTGKLFHIYRPLCIDAKGDKVWAELLIEGGKLRITIPQKWLARAVYPVILDPTFGYTTVGGNNGNPANGKVYTTLKDAPVSSGTVQSMTFRSANALDIYFILGLYSDSSGEPNTLLGKTVNADVTDYHTWITLEIDGTKPSVVQGTDYWCAILRPSGNQRIRFDYGDSGDSFDTVDTTYSDFPSTFPSPNPRDLIWSVYATYEEPAGTTVVPTTVPPTTAAPTTTAPTTLAPTTLAPTTLEPTTLAPTTIQPTTVAPTTLAPTTIAPTTLAPTTLEPTTVAPTTLAPTTLPPTTIAPTTVSPTTIAPTTLAPTTLAPTTLEPTTLPPTTLPPTTLAPTTLTPIPVPTNLQGTPTASSILWTWEAGI